MHIDPLSAMIFNTLGAFLMSAGLFAVSRGYLGEIKSLRRWAISLLLQGIGWILIALANTHPMLLIIEAGSTFTLLSLACQFHALVEFKESETPVRWAYWLVAVTFFIEEYFLVIAHNLTANLVITATVAALLLFANSFLLLAKQQKTPPISHQFTGYAFAACAVMMLIRAIYYGIWNTQSAHSIFQVNVVQDIYYLSFYILVVITSFGFVLMCNDKYFSAQKEALKYLRINEQQLRTLSVAIEQCPASIAITDLDANLLYVNPRFSQVTGYSKDEVLGKNPRLLQSGLTSKETYQQLWKTLKQHEIWHGELVNKRKNGETYHEEVHIAPVKNIEDETTHYVGVKLDISERKQAETDLQHAKAAAIAANQAKSEFLANMSHEIRTPMNAILGFSSILNDLITDSTHRYYLDAIHRSGKTLLQLINDILDLSKIEAGKFTLQYAPVSLTALLDDVSIVFSEKSQDKNIDFSVLIDERLPDNLWLDEVRLRQVILNLVGNAVKFTEQGFIRASVTVRPATSNKHLDLIIRITDSGMGIACDQLEAIFSSFTQQKHQNAGYGGTGLGLTICRWLIEMMGGTISVSSEVGQGSCFTIELPNVEICDPAEPPMQAEKQRPKDVHFQPATVLVVDDSEINRLVIKAYLEDYPELELIEAENGQQVLPLIAQYRFALILMDRIMPGENGDSVCKKIKAMPDYADIPIIMISALVLTAQQPLFYDVQLTKPVNKADLLAALQAFLPIAESVGTTAQRRTVPNQESVIEVLVDPEKRQELVALLICYQEPIKKFTQSGAFKVNALIDIAEQLLELAGQYHCSLLFDWASTLKKQVQLFDVTNLAKTLKGFEELLKQLRI